VSTEKEEDRDPVTKRLDAIIRLLIEQQIRDEKLEKRKLWELLESSGLSSGEIGLIEGQTSRAVASALAKLKKKGLE
jgi:hypothetical protein